MGGPIGVAVDIGVLTIGRLAFASNSYTQLPVNSLECVNTSPYNQAINSLGCSLDKIVIAYGNKVHISSLSRNLNRITVFRNKNIIFSSSRDIKNSNLFRECNFISSLAISRDEKTLASASNDWIMLWDVETGKPLHSFQGCSYPRLSKIEVTPEAIQEILYNKSIQITVKCTDQNKREIKLKDEDIIWESTGGKIEKGLFTASQHEGKFEAKVRVGIFEASVPITIIEPPKITEVVVIPSNVTVEFGKILQFIGQVLDQRGNLMIQETVTWQVSSKGGGAIDKYGFFKAGYNPGKFEIIASAGSIYRSIPITIIEPPKLEELIITSSISKLDFGQSFQFKVKAVDQYGDDIKPGKVTWSASSERIDSNNGVFCASNREETVIIKASVGEINAHVKIEVCEPSRLTKIQVLPSSVTLEPGQEQIFSVIAFNQRGEEISVGDIHWGKTDGIINQSGHFCTKENQKGYCEVTVTVGHLNTTAKIFVLTVLRGIEVSPEEVELKPEEEFLFTVIGFDQTGDRLEIKNVQWSTTAGSSITPKGLFKGNYKQREVIVTAIVGEISATAKVNLLPVLKRLEIYPSFVYLKPGEKQTFTVKGFDQFKDEIDPGEIIWERTGGKIKQNGLLTVTDDDQGYIQVTATSKLTPKHSQNVRTLLLYTGISSKIISLLISYETLQNAVLALDVESAEVEAQLSDSVESVLALDVESAEVEEQLGNLVESEEQLDIDTDANQDTDSIVQTEEGLDIEFAGGTEADALLDTNVFDFNAALQNWLFQKLRKLAARCFMSISRFCFDEAAANLTASADVFVLAVEDNPLAVTPDNQRIVSLGYKINNIRESWIEIWNLNTGELLHDFIEECATNHNYNYYCCCLAITPDGKQIVSGYKDGTIKVWGVPELNE